MPEGDLEEVGAREGCLEIEIDLEGEWEDVIEAEGDGVCEEDPVKEGEGEEDRVTE